MNNSLRIVADENIPFVNEVFSGLGQVTTLPGRTMSAADVAAADVLLVRSVTNVNASLLQHSSVSFVGTCTIGTDHLDLDFLQQNKIQTASAPGCNANSVVQYVLSVMATLRPNWQTLNVGIIGCGNVGGRLYRMLESLGVQVCAYDPWLSPQDYAQLTSLETLLQCDVVCVHTPLVNAGLHPSFHLLDEARLYGLKKGALLINAGRGAVVDNQALKRVLHARADLSVALDVWEPEPLIDLELMQQVDIATPHIAGYSFDGKVAGTVQIYQALCEFLKLPPSLTTAQLLRDDETSQQLIDWKNVVDNDEGIDNVQAYFNQCLLRTYDVREDDQRCRQELLSAEDAQRAEAFDLLRKQYPKRREFSSFQYSGLPKSLTLKEKKSLSQRLATLGIPNNDPKGEVKQTQ